MRVETALLTVLLMAIILVGCMQQQPQGNQTPTPQPTLTRDDLCAQSGGTVKMRPCCMLADDFPDTCLIGACGCSPDNSHQVKVCDCGEGKCWDISQNACITNSQTHGQPGNVSPSHPQNGTYVGMDQIYRYGSVSSYTYNIISNFAGQTNQTLSSRMTSDSVNGTAAWLQEIEMPPIMNVTVTINMWIDKLTFKCIKETSGVAYMGQYEEQNVSCPTEGPYSALRTETTTPQLLYIGEESVTVPAGTYSCKKYSLGGVNYWAANNVPVPVKVGYSNDRVFMELVKYS